MPKEQQQLSKEEELLLDKFGNGSIGKDDLTDNLKSFLFGEEFEGEEVEEEEADAKESENEELEGKQSADKDKKEDSDASTLENAGEKKRKRSKKEIADSENRWRQKHEALMSKFEKAKSDPERLKELLGELGVEHGGYEPPDYISDDNINTNFKSLSDEIAKLKAQIAIKNQVELDRGSDAKTKTLFAEIEDLQEDFPELKTSIPISEINEFVVKNGSHNVPEKVFLDNGFTKEDFENFNNISKIVSTRQKSGFSSLKHAMYETGTYDKIVTARLLNKQKSTQEDVIEKARKELNEKKSAEMAKYPRTSGSTTSSSSHDYNGVPDSSIALKIMEKSERGIKITDNEAEALESWLKTQPIE